MVNSLNIKLPRYFGNPVRHLIKDKNDLIKFYNSNNGINPIFFSVYDEVYIDKLFFDFDGENAQQEAKKLCSYLIENDIKHIILFSGRGFHIYIITEEYKPRNYRNTLRNSQYYILNKLNINMDIADSVVIGDKQRLARMPNSLNQKSHLYCIYLTSNELLNLDIESIKKLALNKRKYIENNNKKYDVKVFDTDNEITLNKQNNNIKISYEKFNIKKLTEKEMSEIMNIFPECISDFFVTYNKTSSFYKKRFYIILFLKDLGFSLETITNFFYTLLTEEKFNKIMREERFDRVFNSNYFAPSCNSLIFEFKCFNCSLYPIPSKKIKENLT